MMALANKKPPKIVFSLTALKWIRALMDEHSTEVGFYAVVDEVAEYEFFIHDVFYPKHCLATGGTCEISPEGETIIMQYLIDHDRVDDIEKIRFWGHKHPGFGSTSPSQQDEDQAMARMNSTGAYLIRAICSGNDISVSFFDLANQVRFDNIKWESEEEDSANALVEKMNRVREVLAEESTEENSEDQGVAIAKIFSNDTEIDLIKEKIKELKKVNIPKEESTSFVGRKQHFPVYDHRRQCGHNTVANGRQMSLLPNRTSTKITPGSGLNENETVELLDEIDQEIEDFYGQGFVG